MPAARRVRPAIPRHPAVVWSRIKLKWPFLVWLLAAVAAVALWLHTARIETYTGTVDAARIALAPVETAKLLSIETAPGRLVQPGDLLARMDASVLDGELAVERLQIRRQFERDVQQLEESIRDAAIRQAEDQAELAVLDTEIERLEGLLARNLVDAQTVSQTRARQRALRTACDLYPEMKAARERELQEARRRRQDMERFMEGSSTEAASAEQERIGLLRMRRERYELRAPVAATVSQLLRAAGDVVPAGEPVLTLVSEGPRTVTAQVPEASAHRISPGARAWITTARFAGMGVSATAVAVGPEIISVAAPSGWLPSAEVRVRQVVFRPDEDPGLLPGESVSIQLLSAELSRAKSPLPVATSKDSRAP